MKSTVLGLVISAVGLTAMVGCSAESGPEETGSEDVVGVTDLKELEVAFDLTIDKLANGKWSRGDDRLTAGGCYKQYKGAGAKEPQNYEFRRYSKGAAFFRKAATGPASGDKRPITCVDFEITDPGGAAASISLDGFGLDSALRYKLGKPTGFDAGMSQLYFAFSQGAIKIRTSDSYCGVHFAGPSVPRGQASIDPGTIAYRDSYWKCIDAHGTDDDCTSKAWKMCTTAVDADVAKESLDRPSYLGSYVTEMTWRDLSPEQAMLAYKFAWAKARSSDLYALSNDPVGRFVSAESHAASASAPGSWHVARFEHLDVHRVVFVAGAAAVKGEESLFITPKSSDKAIKQSAVVSCTREVDADAQPVGLFRCTGL